MASYGRGIQAQVPQEPQMQAYEAINFYARRESGANGRYTIRTPMTQSNDVGGPLVVMHQPFDYSDTLPGHYVRVPNLMVAFIPKDIEQYHRTQQFRNDLERFFNHLIRPQAGYHIFLSSTNFGYFKIVMIVWEGNGRLDQKLVGPDGWSLDLISCIYPCFVRKQQSQAQPQPLPEGDLLLGVAFPIREQNADFTRSYTRFDDQLRNNSCQDVTKEFIARPSKLLMHYRNINRMNVPGLQRIAFYVCRGARLLVIDTRLRDKKYMATDSKAHASRCLYQQGSLVVIYGRALYNLCINEQRLMQGTWPYVTENWLQGDSYSAQRPADEFEIAHDQDHARPLNDLRNKVIFLGTIDSQYQSLCWKIKINDVPDRQNLCGVFLDMPDGGVIQDVTPWETGFELIRWRCKYEQSWKSVIKVDQPSSTQLPFPFEAPADPYVIRRIIGLERKPMTVQYPHEEFSIPKGKPRIEFVEDRDFRHYYPISEVLTNWDESVWRNQIPPPPPPLYPPVKMGDQYYYTDEDEKVLYVHSDDDPNGWNDYLIATNFKKADGTYKECSLQLDSEAIGWPWYKWTQRRENEVNQFLQSGQQQFQTNLQTDPKLWYRQSIDRVKYIKYIKDVESAQSPYTMETLYLKPAQ